MVNQCKEGTAEGCREQAILQLVCMAVAQHVVYQSLGRTTRTPDPVP